MANAQVREVLEYLLAHDEDGTFKSLEEGVGPFLCHRVKQMFDEGQLDEAQWRETVQWIERRIAPESTLSSYHYYRANRDITGVLTEQWPPIRRWYLEKWIAELSRESDV